MSSENKEILPEENDFGSETDIIHIDSQDIFHADSGTIYLRLLLGGFYLLCGLGVLFIALFLSPPQSGSNYINFFVALASILGIAAIGYFVSAWHKRSYRSFINEQGIGCSNSHDIPAHPWSEVDYILQRLYYGGTPPNNGVWGIAPRRLDEDYIVVLKSGERLFFGRRNLGHLSRFKPLILYYSEQNGVKWETQEIYHSRKIKAGSKLIPVTMLVIQLLIPLIVIGAQIGIVYGITNNMFVMSQQERAEQIATRFSWPIEFLERKPEQVNQFLNPGSISPLNVRISSMYLTDDGNSVAFGMDNGAFQLRDIATGSELGTIPNALLSAVVFTTTSQDNTKVITRDFDNQLQVWDINKKKELFSLDVPNKYYHSVVFSADGAFLYFGDLEGRLSVYDLKSENLVKKFQVLQNPIVYTYASREGRKILTGYKNNSVYIWDLFMQGEPISLNLDSELVCAAFTAGNKELGTLERNGTFRIWSYAIRQETFRRPLVTSDNSKIDTFAFSNDGKLLVYGSSTGTVTILSITKSRILETLKVPGMESPTPILDLKFTSDDQYILVGTKYGVWRIRCDHKE